MFKTMDFLGCENDEGVTEVIMMQRKVRDDKPVHLAVAILQYSKLMMLQFVDFVKEHLIPGSYVLVYSGLKETMKNIFTQLIQTLILWGLQQPRRENLMSSVGEIRWNKRFCPLSDLKR